MTKLEIYKGKVYKILLDTLNFKKSKVVNNNENMLNVFIDLQEFVSVINRKDKEMFLSILPVELTNKESTVTIDKVFEIFNLIEKEGTNYINFYKEYNHDLIERLNEEYGNRGYFGSYPKYSKIVNNDRFTVEYDDDIYLDGENLVVERAAIITRVLDVEETMPSFDYDNYSYLTIFDNHLDLIENGALRTFAIGLRNRDYSVELTEEDIRRDLRYLEVMDGIENNNKKLPAWYINERKTPKSIQKNIFSLSLIPLMVFVPILNYVLFNNDLTSLLLLLVGLAIIDNQICKFIAPILYKKYQEQ